MDIESLPRFEETGSRAQWACQIAFYNGWQQSKVSLLARKQYDDSAWGRWLQSLNSITVETDLKRAARFQLQDERQRRAIFIDVLGPPVIPPSGTISWGTLPGGIGPIIPVRFLVLREGDSNALKDLADILFESKDEMNDNGVSMFPIVQVKAELDEQDIAFSELKLCANMLSNECKDRFALSSKSRRGILKLSFLRVIKPFEEHVDTSTIPITQSCEVITCPNTGILRCTRCKLITYCSRECQKLDWKKHRPTCWGHMSDEDSDYAVREGRKLSDAWNRDLMK